MVSFIIEHIWISYQEWIFGRIKKSNWRVHAYMWVKFTAVELWFSQAAAYIFNREVASKDTKQQDFLFLVRQWHRACKFDEKGRFLTSNGNNQDSNLPMNRSLASKLAQLQA